MTLENGKAGEAILNLFMKGKKRCKEAEMHRPQMDTGKVLEPLGNVLSPVQVPSNAWTSIEGGPSWKSGGSWITELQT